MRVSVAREGLFVAEPATALFRARELADESRDVESVDALINWRVAGRLLCAAKEHINTEKTRVCGTTNDAVFNEQKSTNTTMRALLPPSSLRLNSQNLCARRAYTQLS